MGIKKENEQIHQEKKYQFMKEQVRPDRKKEARTICRKLGILVVVAVIFGGIAGITFVAVKFQLEKTADKKTPLISGTAAPTITPTVEPETEVSSGKKKLDFSDENRLSEELAQVGEGMENSFVGVRSKGNSTLWQGGMEGDRQSFGLVFQETKQHYYILTICDTIREQTNVQITMMDESVVEGRIVGSDYVLNLAVVSVSKEKLSKELQDNIKVCHLSGKAQVVNGSKVIAAGAPSGIVGSVMTGTVTHDEIAVPVADNELQMFSTDIPYCDQSNGVVLDINGKLIGVLTREYTEYTGTSGLTFVDIASIQKTINFLRKGKSVPYMGVVARTLTQAAAKAHDLPQGVYVKEVYSKSPAYEAGMRVADVITRIDGEEIYSMEEIHQILVEHNKKETLVCTILRKSGKKQIEKTLKIVLG